MSELTSPRETWSALLYDLSSTCTDEGVVASIPDESTFDQAFVALCAEVRERDPQRLLARFFRQHDQIIAYVGDLDKAFGFPESPSLNSVFWSVAFATVEAALKRQEKGVIFVENLPKLNEAVPGFGAQLELYPHVQQVQEPLQRIFREYIDCYYTMLGQFASHPTNLSFQVFDDRADSARTLFASSKREWQEMVRRAREEEEENRRIASTPSFPQGTLGPLRPYAPRGVSFEWIETLGSGTYGYVSKIRQIGTGTVFAQKVMRVTDPSLRVQFARHFENEVSIMERLRHLHIASVHFHTREEDTFSIVMLPVADCDLLQYLRQGCNGTSFPRIELTHLTSWFGCLVSALAFAHAQNIKHEDIKPRNILIKDHRPFLADFGSAKDFSELGVSTSTDNQTVGTPVYWAPEDRPRGRSADIFALGCVFSEMLTVRQGYTLDSYQHFRYQHNRDFGLAFRVNLPQVYKWMDKLRKPHDPVGDLLIDQTLNMLTEDKAARPDAKAVQRSLRLEGDSVFCTVCF